MSYIEQNLMSGETVIYRSKLHWVVFLSPAILFLIAIVFFTRGGEAAAVGGLFVLIAILTGVASTVSYMTSEFGVTNKRVIVKLGFIRRKSLEVLLNKVESIEVEQGIFGRMLGFGSVRVFGTGGAKDPFDKIDAPLEFRKRAQEQIAAVQDSK